MVTLRVGNDRVTFDGSVWSGEDTRLVQYLELITPRSELSPSLGRLDVFVANHVLPNLEDAEILDVSPDGQTDDAGAIY